MPPVKPALCATFAASLFLSACGPFLQLAPPPSEPPPGSSPSEEPSNEPGSNEPGSSGSSFNEPSSSGSSSSRDSAPKEAPITSVSVDVKNECSDKVEYCIDSGGSTLNTSLGGNTTTSHTMRPGDEIQLKKDNRCSQTIFTAPAVRDRQKVILCKR